MTDALRQTIRYCRVCRCKGAFLHGKCVACMARAGAHRIHIAEVPCDDSIARECELAELKAVEAEVKGRMKT